MKRATFFLIAIVFFLQMTGVGVCAETTSLQPKEQSLTQLLTKSQDAGGLVPAIDPERLPEELPSVEGLPILVQFPYGCWNLAVEDDFYKAVQSFSQKAVIEYIVLSEAPVLLCDNRDVETYRLSTMASVPGYIRGFARLSTKQHFLGELRTIQNAIVLRDGPYSSTALVYLITDRGIFVRFYDSDTEALEYTLEDFRTNAKDYCDFLDYYADYLRAYQKEYGNIIGGPPSYYYFIRDPEAAYERYNYHTVPWTEQYPWAIPGICCVALVTLTPLVFLVIHTIRKKREFTNE